MRVTGSSLKQFKVRHQKQSCKKCGQATFTCFPYKLLFVFLSYFLLLGNLWMSVILASVPKVWYVWWELHSMPRKHRRVNKYLTLLVRWKRCQETGVWFWGPADDMKWTIPVLVYKPTLLPWNNCSLTLLSQSTVLKLPMMLFWKRLFQIPKGSSSFN